METREEIKHFWSIFIVGVPWEKKFRQGRFLAVPFREKEERNKERKDNCSVIAVSFTSPSEERGKYGSNCTFT